MHYMNIREKISKHNLAKNSIYVERELIKERVGYQDQIICSYGGIKEIKFTNKNKFKVKDINLSYKNIHELESSIMIIFTNTERYADKILKEQIQNTKKKLINSQLKELKVITKEAINLVEKKFDMNELAILLNESWRLKKNLSNKITTSSIDELYEYCLTKGAKGVSC